MIPSRTFLQDSCSTIVCEAFRETKFLIEFPSFLEFLSIHSIPWNAKISIILKLKRWKIFSKLQSNFYSGNLCSVYFNLSAYSSDVFYPLIIGNSLFRLLHSNKNGLPNVSRRHSHARDGFFNCSWSSCLLHRCISHTELGAYFYGRSASNVNHTTKFRIAVGCTANISLPNYNILTAKSTVFWTWFNRLFHFLF